MVKPSIPMPVLIGPCVATGVLSARRHPAAVSSATIRTATNGLARMPCPPPLIRKGPCPYIGAQSAPNPRKAERLEYQEEHDERPENQLIQHENGDASARGSS